MSLPKERGSSRLHRCCRRHWMRSELGMEMSYSLTRTGLLAGVALLTAPLKRELERR